VVALVSAMTARRALAKLTPADVDELRRLHQEISSTDGPGRERALNRRFFHIIANAGRSPRLDSILRFLGGALQGSFYFDAPGWARNEASYREQLLDVIDAGDVQAAARISEEHVRSCATVTINHLRGRGYWVDTEPRPAEPPGAA
jgi:DNA-binding FadR family transcriptional regulator